jgi:hypothetical protein
MLSEDMIERVLGAHGKWKCEFAQAIRDASGELTVEEVSADDQCELGMWLQGADVPGKPVPYERVMKLHRDFHVEAGRVFALARAGQPYEAMQAMEPNTPFARLSGSLCYALDQWRFKIRRAIQSSH